MKKIKPTKDEESALALLRDRTLQPEDFSDEFLNKWCFSCCQALTDADTDVQELDDGRSVRQCKKCFESWQEDDDDEYGDEDYAGVDISELN